jgi:large subunit ribosomal protein L21
LYCHFSCPDCNIIVFPQEDEIVYAVIKSGGKQYRVAEGDIVRLEKLGIDAGSEVEFNDVLLVKTDDQTYVGQPTVEGAAVKGVVEEVGLGDKVIVYKFKRRKMYRRTRGHRQHYSDVRIDAIKLAG